MSGNSLRQTVHTHCASAHQAAKLVAALLRVAGVTAGLAESNGSLPPGLWLTSPAGWLPRTGISSGTVRSVIEYGLPFYSVLVPSPAVWFRMPGDDFFLLFDVLFSVSLLSPTIMLFCFRPTFSFSAGLIAVLHKICSYRRYIGWRSSDIKILKLRPFLDWKFHV